VLILVNMEKIGQEIVGRQNRTIHIQELLAQRSSYSKAKKLFYWRLIAIVLIPIIVSFISLAVDHYQENMNIIFGFYTVIATLGGLILDESIKRIKKDAASIQERFDCVVLGITWNEVLLPSKPAPELIHQYLTSFKNKFSDESLVNWYPTVINSINTNLAVLVCQRANCTYDFTLRNRYNFFLTSIVVITLTLLLIPAYYSGLSIQSFFLLVLIPLIPLFVLCFEQIRQNRDSIRNLNELKMLIEQKILDSKLGDSVAPALIRNIQDKIYYNRISSPLIPDALFWKIRPSQEQQMYYCVEDTLRSLDLNGK